jgi:hypothetical protein
MTDKKFLEISPSDKLLLPISYNYIEYTVFESVRSTKEYPTSTRVNIFQTSKFIPSPFYKPISNMTSFFTKND